MLTTLKRNWEEFMLGLPGVQEKIAAEEAAHVDRLENAEAKLIAVSEKEATDVTGLTKQINAKNAEVLAADAELKKRQRELHTLCAARHNVMARAEAARRESQELLAEENESDVREWLDKFLAELARLRNDSIIESEQQQKYMNGNPVIAIVANNVASIAERIRAVVDACGKAEQLRCSVVDAGAHLQELWDALPEVELRKTGR